MSRPREHPQGRTVKLTIRVAPSEATRFKRAAKVEALGFTTWVRAALTMAADIDLPETCR